MNNNFFNLNNIRFEISFKSFEELLFILSFYENHNLQKINIPCKNNLKKDFLLSSIKLSKKEFPNIDIIPHFSILHEFRKNKFNTQNSFINFLKVVNNLGCKNVLLISGSQKRSTLDSVSALNQIKNNSLFSNSNFSLGVAFNPYLPSDLFKEEIIRLEKKLKSGLVSSIWIQFGTDFELLENRIHILNEIIFSSLKNNNNFSNVLLFGSILIPSKQFLARFKYRPWKGVYCSSEFLESVDFANNVIKKILETYMQYQIIPIIETCISNEQHLNSLKALLNQ
tara:strand:- start:1311 stop:2156 length:846 start_codon:yes stop_codon:yes gene_type:complete